MLMNQRIYVLSPELIIVFLIDEWTSYFMKVLNGLGGFLKNKKKEAKGIPSASDDQPERRSIIWIDIFILLIQDIDIDPYKEPSGLAVIHHGLLGSIPR